MTPEFEFTPLHHRLFICRLFLFSSRFSHQLTSVWQTSSLRMQFTYIVTIDFVWVSQAKRCSSVVRANPGSLHRTAVWCPRDSWSISYPYHRQTLLDNREAQPCECARVWRHSVRWCKAQMSRPDWKAPWHFDLTPWRQSADVTWSFSAWRIERDSSVSNRRAIHDSIESVVPNWLWNRPWNEAKHRNSDGCRTEAFRVVEEIVSAHWPRHARCTSPVSINYWKDLQEIHLVTVSLLSLDLLDDRCLK